MNKSQDLDLTALIETAQEFGGVVKENCLSPIAQQFATILNDTGLKIFDADYKKLFGLYESSDDD